MSMISTPKWILRFLTRNVPIDQARSDVELLEGLLKHPIAIIRLGGSPNAVAQAKALGCDTSQIDPLIEDLVSDIRARIDHYENEVGPLSSKARIALHTLCVEMLLEGVGVSSLKENMESAALSQSGTQKRIEASRAKAAEFCKVFYTTEGNETERMEAAMKATGVSRSQGYEYLRKS